MTEPGVATQGAPTDLTCPKCGGRMRAYERNGITVDQCTDCRGIFLDRGELERLIEAEDVHYTRDSGPVPPPERAYPDQRYPDEGYREQGHDGGGKHGGGGDSRRRRPGGFLGDLLDFG